MSFATEIDDRGGKPAWILAMVLGFVAYWPIGLAVLFYLATSGRLRAWKLERMGRQMGKLNRWCGAGSSMPWQQQSSGRGFSFTPSSGNAAFDDYRAETLKRLEDEQREFKDYLERLRQAKDRSEFEQFMAERRNRPVAPTDGNSH